MLDNNKYFNQVLISSDTIKKRLEPFIMGLDMEKIKELVDKEIKEKYLGLKKFEGKINDNDLEIYFSRNFVQYSAIWVSEELAQKMYSKIIVKEGNITLVLVGLDNEIQAKRNDVNGEIVMKSFLNCETGIVSIEQSETVKEELDEKSMDTLLTQREKAKIKKKKR